MSAGRWQSEPFVTLLAASPAVCHAQNEVSAAQHETVTSQLQHSEGIVSLALDLSVIRTRPGAKFSEAVEFSYLSANNILVTGILCIPNLDPFKSRYFGVFMWV